MKKAGCWHGVLLCGLAVISFDALAEQSPASNQAPKWGPHVDVETKLGTSRNIGELDLFLPLGQNSRTLMFADLRARSDDKTSGEGNFGLGVRHMLDSGWNLGGYGYLDRRKSAYDNYFSQVTLGVEALGRDLELRFNGYIPTGRRSYDVNSLSAATLSGNSVIFSDGVETSMAGYDGEIGWRAPQFAAPESNTQFRLYLGAYSFSADNAPTIAGPRVRFELTFDQLPGLWRGARLSFGGEMQQDGPRGGQSFVNLRLRVPLGATAGEEHQLDWQARRMTAPIVRDVDVVTAAGPYGRRETATETAGGSAITVLSSSSTTGANLPTAVTNAGANSTVILSGIFNTTATTTLQSGQTLIGGGSLTVKAPSGRTATLSLPTATVSATIGGTGPAASNPGFMMANDSTLDGLNVSLTRSGGVGTIAVYATNVSGATIRNSTITATETGANSADGVVVGNATSNITVSGNTISAVAQPGQSASAFLLVNAGGGAAATVTGNTLSATGGTNNWVVFLNGGTFNAGSTGNVRSAGTCHSLGGTGTLYFTDGTTCP